MRIGIDLRPLQAETKHRGIGKSLEFLMKEIARLQIEDDLVFYIDSRVERPEILSIFPKERVIEIRSLSLTRKKYVRSIFNPWQQIKVSSDDIDVLLQYDATMGIPSNIPTVVIFHDLIPYIFHEEEKKLAKEAPLKRRLKNQLAGAAYWQQYNRFLKRYKNASTIIAISEASKNDYMHHFPRFDNQRIVTIPHGVNESFFIKKAQKLSPYLKEKITKPYFLYVGGIDYRKNIMGLVRDFLEARLSHNIQLVLVGKEFSLQEQLDDLGWSKTIGQYPANFKKDIIRPGFIEHDDLIALLSNARAFVFPSRYEGFGMPLLEAMAVGCPVITYGNSSLKEVVGSHGSVISDGESFTPVIKKILTHPDEFLKKIPGARKKAGNFTWSRTSNSIIKELHRYKDTAKK